MRARRQELGQPASTSGVERRRRNARSRLPTPGASAPFDGPTGQQSGWLSKARRLLEGEPEGVEHGYHAATETLFLIGKARRAGAEAEGYDLHHGGFASYEIGEIRLRGGDLAAAHAAFRRAHELGMQPQPGLSLLRLREGRVQEASASIADAVTEAGGDRLKRARLPAELDPR